MILNLPKLGPTRFRDGMTPDEIEAQVQRLGKIHGFELPKPELGLGTIAKQGFLRSAGETGIALGDTLPAMAGSALGAKDYAKQQMAEADATRAELEAQYPTQFKSFKEANTPGKAAGYVAETLGELGPSALTAIIPGVGAGAVASRIAGQAALKKGATTIAANQAAQKAGRRAMYGGVYMGSFAQNAPEVFEGIYKETGKFEPGLAALAGGISSVLDTIVPGQVLDQLGAYGKQRAIAELAKNSGAAPKVWKTILGTAASTAAKEGVTESAQEAINAQAKHVAGSLKDIFHPENMAQYQEAFVKGAIGGSAFGTIGGTGQALANRAEVRDTQEAQNTMAAQDAAAAAAQNVDPAKAAQFDATQEADRQAKQAELEAAFKDLPTFKTQQQQADEYYGQAFKDLPEMQYRLKQLQGLQTQLTGIPETDPRHAAVQENINALQELIRSKYGRENAVPDTPAPAQVIETPPPVEAPQPTAPIAEPAVPEPTVVRKEKPKRLSPLAKELDGLDVNNVDQLSTLLTKAQSKQANRDQTIDWQKLEQRLQQVPKDVLDAAEAKVRGVAPKQTPVEPIESAPPEAAPVQAAQPVTPTQPAPLPELEGRDPNNVDHVTDLLNLSEGVKDKNTKQQMNSWLDTVPRDVLSEAMKRTEGDAVTSADAPVNEPAPVPSKLQMPEMDVQRIVSGLGDAKRMRGLSEQERDAQAYFGRFDPDLAIKSIANDIVNQDTPYRNSKMKAFDDRSGGPEPFFASQKEADTFKGQGGQHARLAANWVRANLSPDTNAKLTEHIERFTKEKAKIKRAAKERERAQGRKQAEKAQVENENRQQDVNELAETTKAPKRTLDDFNLLTGKFKADEDTAALHTEAHPVVLDAIRRGDMSRVMTALSESPSSELAGTIARKLKPFMTNVNVTPGAVSSYDPNTNTITLRDNATEYEVMHEATHAAVSHVLDNRAHPVTRQLNSMFDAVRKDLGDAYGAQNLQEFVAEVWSNDSLRNKLAEMRVGNTNVSLWDKLINAVRRFLGLPVASQSALDKTDSMINEIISAPPESRSGDSMYAQSINNPEVTQRMFRDVDKVVASAPLMNPQRATAFVSTLEKLTTAGKGLALRLLNLSALGQIGSRVVGQDAITFADMVEKKAGYQGMLTEENYPLHRRLQVFAKSPNYQKWSTLVHDSTLADINPEAKRSRYVGSPTKLAEYDKLKSRFDSLKPDEKQLYRDLFATYKRLDKELESSLQNNIKEIIPDAKVASSAYEKILKELSTLRIEHYAPLYRKGTYWLSYELNGDLHKPLFETQAERDAARRKAEAAGATNIDEYTNIEQMTSRNVPDGTVLESVIKILQDSGAGSDAIDRVAEMVVKAMPESSILKSRQRREGISGYVDDAAWVFDNVSSSTIHQLANMKYGGTLQRLIKHMAATGNQLRGDDNEKARLLVKELQDRYKFIMHPNISNIAQFASTGSFFYFLAGNVSSAVVNMLQLPLIVAPQLAGEYGVGNMNNAMAKAMRLYTSSGLKRKVTELTGNVSEQNSMLSLENLVNDGKLPEYKNLVDKLREYGFLQNTTARDAVTSSNQTSSMYGGMTRLHYLTNLAGTFMFHHAERMNREVTALAAYELEKNKLQNNKSMTPEAKEAQAIDKALRAVQYMHGAGHTETGPSIGHSNLGKVMMVFKRFAFSMYYMLFDTMRRALPLNGNDKEGMRVARRQLVGMYGMSALFAGLKGLPMYWVMEAAYNALKDDDEDDFDTTVRKYFGDMPYKGPVNYYTNLAIADRVGWTDLIFREARSDKADASTLSQLIESALGAPYSIANNMLRAKELASDGHMQRAIETALPIGMRNVLKGYRYGDEGANTLRGDPVMGEISGTSAAAQALGFAPADLSRQYETNAYIKKESDRILQKRDSLAKKYYVALRNGDMDKAMDLRNDLMELGAKYPELGVDDAFLEKSVSTRDRISEDMYHGITIPKRLRQTMIDSVSQFDE